MTLPYERPNEKYKPVSRFVEARFQAKEKEAAEKGGKDLLSVLERIPVPLDELPPSAALEVLIDVLYADSELSSNRMKALCQRLAEVPESSFDNERLQQLQHAMQYAADRAMLPKATGRMIRKRVLFRPGE